MNKLAIIYFEWQNTSGNHAGMAYFVKQIHDANPLKVELIKIPVSFPKWNWIRKKIYHLQLISYFKKHLSEDDGILFMEYLGGNSGDQTQFAILARKLKLKCKMYGMVHLPGSKLLQFHKRKSNIKNGVEAANHLVVMGSSLKQFFSELGYSKKILTMPHYVDNYFYTPSIHLVANEKLQICTIGNMLRDFSQLKEIIEKSGTVHFHICGCKSKIIAQQLAGIKNTTVYGYLSEVELLELMQKSDISLSVMHDTVGSNVIVTSLAVGLPQVVSDVGSIRDYCDEKNTIFCKSTEDFINAIEYLATNREQLHLMSESAKIKSNEFALSNLINWFEKNILNA